MNIAAKPLGHAVLAISLVVGVSAAVLAVASVSGEKGAWALFGFEIVSIAAAVLGVLYGVGKFRDAPGMALACIGGTFVVAAVLGWKSLTASAGQGKQVGGVPLLPLVSVQALGGMAVALAGALMVLGREARSWRPAIMGALLGAPIAILGVLIVLPRTRDAVVGGLTGNTVVGLVVLAVMGVLLAASVHLVVRAFEMASVSSE